MTRLQSIRIDRDGRDVTGLEALFHAHDLTIEVGGLYTSPSGSISVRVWMIEGPADWTKCRTVSAVVLRSLVNSIPPGAEIVDRADAFRGFVRISIPGAPRCVPASEVPG